MVASVADGDKYAAHIRHYGTGLGALIASLFTSILAVIQISPLTSAQLTMICAAAVAMPLAVAAAGKCFALAGLTEDAVENDLTEIMSTHKVMVRLTGTAAAASTFWFASLMACIHLWAMYAFGGGLTLAAVLNWAAERADAKT